MICRLLHRLRLNALQGCYKIVLWVPTKIPKAIGWLFEILSQTCYFFLTFSLFSVSSSASFQNGCTTIRLLWRGVKILSKWDNVTSATLFDCYNAQVRQKSNKNCIYRQKIQYFEEFFSLATSSSVTRNSSETVESAVQRSKIELYQLFLTVTWMLGTRESCGIEQK